MNVIGNFNIYEILWVTTTLMAFYVAYKNREAAKRTLALVDNDLAITSEDSPSYPFLKIEERIAKGHVRRERSRLIVNGLWALVGMQSGIFIAAQLTNPLAGILLIFTSLVLLYDSLRDAEDRLIIEASD